MSTTMPPKPTPPNVLDAVHVVAGFLRERGYGGAIISPQGGASFNLRNPLDEKCELLGMCQRLVAEIERQRRDKTRLRRFIKWSSSFVGWSRPDDFDEQLADVLRPSRRGATR